LAGAAFVAVDRGAADGAEHGDGERCRGEKGGETWPLARTAHG
jgi:hypothetical protein